MLFRGGREGASQVAQGRVESSLLSFYSVEDKFLVTRGRWQGPNAKGARRGKERNKVL